MNETFQKLLSDTITYCKENGHIIQSKPLKKTPLIPLKKKPVVIEKKEEVIPKQVIHISTPKMPLREKMKKHLPHIEWVEEVPNKKSVALVIISEEELPFFQKLKEAIEEKFYPVDLFIETFPVEKVQSYTCILSQKEISLEKGVIPLELSEVYKQSTDKKRALWSHICQILSQASS